MSDMPWVRFFPSDWLAGTRGMSAAETGIYITLIATMYERGEPVPEDHARLARLCGASNSVFRKTLDVLIDEGKITRVEGGIWNDRVGRESEIRAEKSAVGAQAAQARWNKKSNKNNADGDAFALQAQSERNANQKPETREESPHTPLSGGEAVFDGEVWEVFPRHLNSTRSDALTEYEKLSPADQADCRGGVLAYRADHDRAVAAGRAPIPKKLSTWIAKRGWEGLTKPTATGAVVVIRPDDADFQMVMDAKGGNVLLSKAGNINISADELEAIRRAASGQARAAA
jgi:uncharacterized protein YdaU (DUF1376 family)